MRLNSTAFTHSSTALFGLAVAGYAVLRLAGYDAPSLPGHLALPTPPIIQPGADPWRADVDGAHESGLAEAVTPLAVAGQSLRTRAADETSRIVVRLVDASVASQTRAGHEEVPADDPQSTETTTTVEHQGSDSQVAPTDDSTDTTDSTDSTDSTSPEGSDD